MAQQPQRPAGPNYTYVDLPELSEAYADSIQTLLYDGQTLKITFVVNRIDDPTPGKTTTGKRYPVFRLVMPAPGAHELIDKLNQLGAAIATDAAAVGSTGRTN